MYVRRVSILMPALNEERYIKAAIESVTPDGADLDYELIVLDGGSTDATREIVTALGASNPRIRLVANERRLQSAGLNIGAQLADPCASILIRADSHALYPLGFVSQCVEKLGEHEAVSIVVTMQTTGVSGFQKGVAAAQNSRLGNGGSAHRRPGPSRYIDHGHHAAFDRAAFLSAGGYDETLVANEDAELDSRLAAKGGRIWLETSIPVIYYPRETLPGLARQYFRYGTGRALSFRRHRYRLKLRQLLPVFILAGNAIGLVGALVSSALWILVPAGYASICIGWGVAAAIKEREPSVAWSMGVAAMAMHLSWALGFLANVLRLPAAGGGQARARRNLAPLIMGESHKRCNTTPFSAGFAGDPVAGATFRSDGRSA